MNDFWKGVIAALTLQWLFKNVDGCSGCGCVIAIIAALGLTLFVLGTL